MAVSSAINGTSPTAAATTSTTSATIAQNFQTFLQLLTTQLKNQNPLTPLDTNQFTQQLVQFAQVEQQIGMNTSLGTLINLQQTAQTTAAMSFLGANIRVNGDTAPLTNGKATWSFKSDKVATGTVTVQAASGETVYTEQRAITAGPQSFVWNGRSNNGSALPEGRYKVTITAKDASGQAVGISTEVEGVVDGVDVTQNPPVVMIGQQSFTIDKIKQVRRPTT